MHAATSQHCPIVKRRQLVQWVIHNFLFYSSPFWRFLSAIFLLNHYPPMLLSSLPQSTRGTVAHCHLPVAKQRHQWWVCTWIFVLFVIIPKISNCNFFQLTAIRPWHCPSSLSPKGKLACRHHSPLSNCKEKAATVSLFMIVCFIPQYSQDVSLQFFQLNCYLSMVPPFHSQSTNRIKACCSH